MVEYVKHTGGSVAGKSRKPYDAMVYKDADSGYTIAVDGNGNVIKKVLSSLNTDDVVIQAAINYGKSVYVASGDYNISTTILFNSDYCSFTGSGIGATRIVLSADTTGICLLDCARVSVGGFSIKINAAQTEDVVVLQSVNAIVRYCKVFDIRIESGDGESVSYDSIGIRAEDSTFRTSFVYNTLENITTTYCQRAMYFSILKSNGWINANTFSRLKLGYPIIGVDFTDAVGTNKDFDHNLFQDIHIQAGSGTTDGFKNIWKTCNLFVGCVVWDWQAVTAPNYVYSFQMGGGNYAMYNQVISTETWPLRDVFPAGSTNRFVHPDIRRIESKNIRMVTPIVGNYTSLKSAIESITDASDTNRYTIVVQGYIKETSPFSAKSYVDVVGIGGAVVDIDGSSGTGVLFNGADDCIWKDITIRRTGSLSSGGYVMSFSSGDDTIVIENCNLINMNTGANGGGGIIIYNSSPTIRNCYISASSLGNGGAGIYINEAGSTTSPSISNCEIHGASGNNSSGTNGVTVNANATPVFKDCKIYGAANNTQPTIAGCICYDNSHLNMTGCEVTGGSATYAHGMAFWHGSSGILKDCIIHAGDLGLGSRGLDCSGGSEIRLENCTVIPKEYIGSFTYSGTTAEFLPVSGHPYYISKLYVDVTTGVGTLNIGTTPAGTEIASAIDISTTGKKYPPISYVGVAADSPIYLTPSSTDARFKVYYVYSHNYSGSYAINISSVNRLRAFNCKFYSNQASSAGYITTTARTAGKFLAENCSFESVGTYDLEGQSSGVVPVYNCTFARGSLNNITLPGQGTAATITTGNTYVDVTHSLAATPTKVRVTPTTNLGTRSFWVDTKGAATFRININSSDVINHTFDWEAEV